VAQLARFGLPSASAIMRLPSVLRVRLAWHWLPLVHLLPRVRLDIGLESLSFCCGGVRVFGDAELVVTVGGLSAFLWRSAPFGSRIGTVRSARISAL